MAGGDGQERAERCGDGCAGPVRQGVHGPGRQEDAQHRLREEYAARGKERSGRKGRQQGQREQPADAGRAADGGIGRDNGNGRLGDAAEKGGGGEMAVGHHRIDDEPGGTQGAQDEAVEEEHGRAAGEILQERPAAVVKDDGQPAEGRPRKAQRGPAAAESGQHEQHRQQRPEERGQRRAAQAHVQRIEKNPVEQDVAQAAAQHGSHGQPGRPVVAHEDLQEGRRGKDRTAQRNPEAVGGRGVGERSPRTQDAPDKRVEAEHGQEHAEHAEGQQGGQRQGDGAACRGRVAAAEAAGEAYGRTVAQQCADGKPEVFERNDEIERRDGVGTEAVSDHNRIGKEIDRGDQRGGNRRPEITEVESPDGGFKQKR